MEGLNNTLHENAWAFVLVTLFFCVFYLMRITAHIEAIRAILTQHPSVKRRPQAACGAT